MKRGEYSDQENLLSHPASISHGSQHSTDFDHGYELQELGSSDIGSHQGYISSLYPPAYQPLPNEGDVEQKGASSSSSRGTYQESQRSRKSAFSTFSTRSKPAVKNTWTRFLRWILRSGSHGSHLALKTPAEAHEHRKWTGWRGGCFAAACAAGVVLLINIIFTIWAGSTSKSGSKIGNLYEGDCSTVHTADSWLHIAINAMGTMLLGASNYSMQILSSPTRREIDNAHSRGRYADIGIPSMRNLRGWSKKILIVFLVISTLPLHFLWNSAIFTTTQKLDYYVYLVTPNFFKNSTIDCTQPVSQSSNSVAMVHYVNAAPVFQANRLGPLSSENVTYEATHDSSQVGKYAGMATDNSSPCLIASQLFRNFTTDRLVRLSNEDCINSYGKGNSLMKDYGNVLVVTKDQPPNSNASVLLEFEYSTYVSNYTGNVWVCGPEYLLAHNYQCNYKDLALTASSWSLGKINASVSDEFQIAATPEYEIDYCLSSPTDIGGKCQLQYSLVIMICVILANIIKFACIIALLWTQKEPVLATIGDGIATFLERPDPTTIERPFLGRNKARNFRMAATRQPVRWKGSKRVLRWWQAPSLVRWSITLILCIIAIAVAAMLLKIGNESVANGGYSGTPISGSPYALGFGTYNAAATLNVFDSSESPSAEYFSSNKILMSRVAMANVPQVIVSSLYFAYNTIYTSMVSANEWSRFSTTAKTLRTTDPRGAQRSTYWLSLPWTYGLPLAVTSSVLHWLISQALFIARTEVLDTNGMTEDSSYMEIGYSPLAILLALLFGTGMVIGMVINGMRKLPGGVLVGNNSLAIAAACQRPEWEKGAELGRVRWGALCHEDKGVPGHCSFSGVEEVEAPKEGMLYI